MILFVVGESFSPKFLEKLYEVKKKNPSFPIVLLDTPAQNLQLSRKKLEDLATYLGTRIIDLNQLGTARQYNNFDWDIDNYGSCGAIQFHQNHTLFQLPLEKNRASIDNCLSNLVDNLNDPENKTNDDLLYSLRSRIDTLKGVNITLHVGGTTPAERFTREALAEDACYACQSAVTHGIVPGMNIVTVASIGSLLSKATYKSGEYYLLDILRKAFSSIFIQIALQHQYYSEWNTGDRFNFKKNKDGVEEALLNLIKHKKIMDFRTGKIASWEATTVKNSTNIEIEIVNSVISMLKLIAGSGQLITSMQRKL
jgi:hypothetical protein